MTDTPDNEALVREAEAQACILEELFDSADEHGADHYEDGCIVCDSPQLAAALLRRLAAALQAASRAPQSVPEEKLAELRVLSEAAQSATVDQGTAANVANAAFNRACERFVRAMLAASPTPPTLDAGKGSRGVAGLLADYATEIAQCEVFSERVAVRRHYTDAVLKLFGREA